MRVNIKFRNSLYVILIFLILPTTLEAGILDSYRQNFILGDWRYMSPILICLILGLAFAIERILALNLAMVNTENLLDELQKKLAESNINSALEICKSYPGPVASLLHEGIRHIEYGPESVEKAIITTGSIQIGKMEQGLIWISLFISLAPMLGFLGTVVGMIQAFDNIEMAGDISPAIVAGGIKVALLTTVFGLIVAIILQVFYNYIVSKIDQLTGQMETGSTAFMDILRAHRKINSK